MQDCETDNITSQITIYQKKGVDFKWVTTMDFYKQQNRHLQRALLFRTIMEFKSVFNVDKNLSSFYTEVSDGHHGKDNCHHNLIY